MMERKGRVRGDFVRIFRLRMDRQYELDSDVLGKINRPLSSFECKDKEVTHDYEINKAERSDASDRAWSGNGL